MGFSRDLGKDGKITLGGPQIPNSPSLPLIPNSDFGVFPKILWEWGFQPKSWGFSMDFAGIWELQGWDPLTPNLLNPTDPFPKSPNLSVFPDPEGFKPQGFQPKPCCFPWIFPDLAKIWGATGTKPLPPTPSTPFPKNAKFPLPSQTLIPNLHYPKFWAEKSSNFGMRIPKLPPVGEAGGRG